MKSTILALVLILFLPFFSSQQFLRSSNASSPEQVVDTSGKTLRSNADYYIVPAVPFTICGFVSCFNTTGSITLDTNTQSSCPLDVVIMKANQGIPINFSPINPKKGVIHVSTDLNVRFIDSNVVDDDDENKCPQYSRVWKLDKFDDSNESQIFITTGGVLGHPGPKTILNWFKIEEYDGAYKLVYCPNVCQSCKHLCKDIGMFVDKNRRMRLALSDVPFKVKFQKP